MNQPTPNPVFLVVDAFTPTRYALKLQLKQFGARVSTASSAEQALACIADDPPDAIFADRVLPGINGLELMQLLQRDAATARIPFIICCPDSHWPLRALAHELGVLAVVERDNAAQTLPDIVRRLRSAEPGGERREPPPSPAASIRAGEAGAPALARSVPRPQHPPSRGLPAASRPEAPPARDFAPDAARTPLQSSLPQALGTLAQRSPSGVRRDAKYMAIGAAFACVGFVLLSLF
jgi:twitching motility two-component system response regulator PilH